MVFCREQAGVGVRTHGPGHGPVGWFLGAALQDGGFLATKETSRQMTCIDPSTVVLLDSGSGVEARMTYMLSLIHI